MLESFWRHHSRVACCQVSKDRKLIVYSIFIQLLRWWTPWSSSLCWVQHFGYLQAQISSGWWLVIGDLKCLSIFWAVWSDLQEPATCCISIRVTKQNTRCTAWAERSNIFTHLSNYSATGIQLQTILSLWPSVWELLGLKKKPEVGWPCILAVAQLISWRGDYTYYSRDLAAS